MRSDLVRRDEVMKSLTNEYNIRFRAEGIIAFGGLRLAWIEKAINDVHSAVPEIIRCRECKHGEVDNPCFPDQYLCRRNGSDWNNGDHYCGYAERKEGT